MNFKSSESLGSLCFVVITVKRHLILNTTLGTLYEGAEERLFWLFFPECFDDNKAAEYRY